MLLTGRRFGLILALSFCMPVVAGEISSASGSLVHRYRGVDLQSPCLRVVTNVRTLSACVLWCHQHPSCRAGSYHTTRLTCCLSDVMAYQRNASYVEDDDSWYFQPVIDIAWHDGWALAFRAQAGCGIIVYDAWSNYSHHDDAPFGNTALEFGCLTLNGSRPCNSHFRSKYLDVWDSLNIKEVALRMYSNGIEVVNIVFNGTGSSVTSWMTPSRILWSPWNDVTATSSTFNYFGINPIPRNSRYFFINKNYGGCVADVGWLCAVGPLVSRAPCPWEDNPRYPVFLYSKARSSTMWQSGNVGTADVLAVLVKN